MGDPRHVRQGRINTPNRDCRDQVLQLDISRHLHSKSEWFVKEFLTEPLPSQLAGFSRSSTAFDGRDDGEEELAIILPWDKSGEGIKAGQNCKFYFLKGLNMWWGTRQWVLKFKNSVGLEQFIINNAEVSCHRNSSVGTMYQYIKEMAYTLQKLTIISVKWS